MDIQVLLVEDSPADVRMIREAFSENSARRTMASHFVLVHVERLSQALERLRTESFGVILLDLGLPDSQGIQTVEAVSRSYPGTPIVILTVHDDEMWALEAMHSGAQDYISKKDLDGPSLRRAVRYAMERKRAEREHIDFAAAQAARHESERASENMRRLQLISDTAIEHISHDQVVEHLLDKICEVLKSDSAAVLLMNSNGTDFDIRKSRTSKGNSEEKPGANRARSILAGRIRDTLQPQVLGLDEIHAESPVSGLVPAGGCIAGAPMLIHGKLFGILYTGFHGGVAIGEDDFRLLQLIADRMAFVLDHARLYEEERKAKAEAELQSRLKDEFLATMSHELRTPLSAILGWSRLICAGQVQGPVLARGMAAIERNAAAQAALIDDLLDISRIVAGKLSLDVQATDLSSVIEDVLVTFRPGSEAKNIQLQGSYDPEAGLIDCDPHRLRQVIGNLVSNAIKFTPAGGHAFITLKRSGSTMEIAVGDDGQGIDEDFLPHVFERFRQGQGASTRRHGGLGIGLAVVKHIVEHHGGTVHADSGGSQKGATFTVRLPVKAISFNNGAAQRGAATESKPLFSPKELDGVRILVVDDEPDTRGLLEVVFQNCSAHVTSVGTAVEALIIIGDDAPDVLISDIGMPDIDGYELIRRVRAMDGKASKSVPAIALTAYGRTDDRSKSLACGFDLHVSKPVDPAELVAAVAGIVDRQGSAKGKPV
jgi:signal transduction histidine kinase/CheY-like chemotaxis protein